MLGRHAGRPPGAAPTEGQLPPEGTGTARTRRTRRGTPQGQRHRTGVPGHRRLLRDLPQRPGRSEPGPLPIPRPALRPLAARPGLPTGAGGRDPADQRLPGRAAGRHLGIDAQVRFASAAARTAFAEELARTVATLVSRYHDESAAGAAATGWSSDCTRSPHRPPPTRAGARSEPWPGSAREKSAQDESAQEKENRT